jgi:hypothetical protein
MYSSADLSPIFPVNPMRGKRMRTLTAVAAAATLVALSGCAVDAAPRAADDAAPPSASASEQAAEPATAEVLMLSGSLAQTLAAGDVVVESAAFADGPGAVVDLITGISGAPEVTEIGEECASAQTLYEWEGLTLSDWAGDGFVVTAHAATSGEIGIEVPGGFSVGDDLSTRLSTFPEADVARPGGGDVFVSFDTVSRAIHGDYDSPVGAVGYMAGGTTLTSIIAPGEWSSFLC